MTRAVGVDGGGGGSVSNVDVGEAGSGTETPPNGMVEVDRRTRLLSV